MRTVRLAFALLAAVAAFGVLIFWPAGRLDWLAGWLYLGLVALNFLANLVYLEHVNPELVDARMRMA